MFNKIIFGGSLYKRNWSEYLMDLNIREYSILLILVIFTIVLGVYPSIITDGLNYISTGLLYSFDNVIQGNNF
jgi:NADH-ubiquinone oxidoreductase chain 4